MDAKETAKELVKKFDKYVDFTNDDFITCQVAKLKNCKQCALIAVRFAIEQIGTSCSDCQDEQTKKFNFLTEVEQEIEKL